MLAYGALAFLTSCHSDLYVYANVYLYVYQRRILYRNSIMIQAMCCQER